MLRERILFTLKFFDLQHTPLTLLQLRDFLFNEPELIRASVDQNFEIVNSRQPLPAISEAQIVESLANDLSDQVEFDRGYYCLCGKKELIQQYFETMIFRQRREQLIARFISFLRFIPFVRGVAVGGSQTLGQSKANSDIDLLIILDANFLWLGRLLVTGYFQLTGHRRHGQKIANRFCLNHYLAGSREVLSERDPYNAMEYLRLQPKVFPETIASFVAQNLFWIQQFFPNARIPTVSNQSQPKFQLFLEKLFLNSFGRWLNQRLGLWQMTRIMRGTPAVANDTELSFHSRPRKLDFLTKVFRH